MAGAALPVSVVIPTYQRPDLISRAVRSALDQTGSPLEVIVVVDGDEPATREALAACTDPRLRVVVPGQRLGNAEARNAGVREARAEWVAFLDDDDEWLPRKLERQWATASRSRIASPIVSCRLIARSDRGDLIWPRRYPGPGEPLSEYFFCRGSPFTGEGMVINSGIFARRDLLTRVPFTSGLTRHVDPDWLLRAALTPGAALEFVPEPEPLLIWHVERDRARITTARDWQESLAWCRERRELFTPAAYAAFVLHVVGSNAAAQGARGTFLTLLREAFGRGRPAMVDLVSHFGNYLLPHGVQRRLAALYGRLTAERPPR
jgi:glycosyltransferase involved in cell wall biosynthesis